LDQDYGVQVYDLGLGEYHVHVSEGVLPAAREEDVFSNPAIGTFGPPRKKR
jgi:hypothetical protein